MSERVAAKKIQSTRDYRKFVRSTENRVLDLSKHKKLERSMREYGFLPSFPLSVHRNGSGLEVKDGQHRLAIAEMLNLPVHYVEEKVDYDVAKVNSTAKVWAVRDYAQKYAANGNKNYQDGLDFADRHGLPVSIAFSLLSGHSSSKKSMSHAYQSGEFKVKDREYADNVASLYVPMTTMSKHLKNVRFLESCMAVCRVDGFDRKRMLQNAARCQERLGSFSTREAYLQMLEEIYNFGRNKLVGLKSAAVMALKERNAAKPASK